MNSVQTIVRLVTFTLLVTIAVAINLNLDSDDWFLRLSDRAMPRRYHVLDRLLATSSAVASKDCSATIS